MMVQSPQYYVRRASPGRSPAHRRASSPRSRTRPPSSRARRRAVRRARRAAREGRRMEMGVAGWSPGRTPWPEGRARPARHGRMGQARPVQTRLCRTKKTEEAAVPAPAHGSPAAGGASRARFCRRPCSATPVRGRRGWIEERENGRKKGGIYNKKILISGVHNG
jgi:hypothetical protein